jgi:hypothetical protein
MLPSSQALAENVRAHCEAMAWEISRRTADRNGWQDAKVYPAALSVLLDWFLGDWVPPDVNSGKLPADGDSNTRHQGG